MSIKLDWEVESEGGWSEVGEDAAALAARRRQARLARTIIIVLLVIGLVVGALVGFRLYAADQQARSDLQATVAAEAAAIRIGDSSAYLDIQENVGSWRQMQADQFTQYKEDSQHVKPDGQIVTLNMDGSNGRVVVREMVDNKPYNVVWFYQQEQGVWKHVPPEIAFWGFPRELTGPHYDIFYWDEDADFARALQAKIETWWNQACQATSCRDVGGNFPDLMKLRIEPDPLLQMGWATYDPQHTLRIPSPLLGRVPADGSIDPALERALAGYVAGYWGQKLIAAPQSPTSDLAWAHDEFQQWLVSMFVPGSPPAPLLGPLDQTSGTPAVMALLGRVGQSQDVLAALGEVTGKDPAGLPVAWDSYLTYRLRAETALLSGDHPTEALLLYADPERANKDLLAQIWLPLRNTLPDSITVTSTRRVGDLLWAETTYQRLAERGDTPGPILTYLPFRIVNGRWVHTVAQPADFGDKVEERGQHIVLHYPGIDAPSVERLLPDLEQQYTAITTDLGIGQPQVDIEITANATGDGFAPTLPQGTQANLPDGITIWIGSAYTSMYTTDHPLPDALRTELTRQLTFQLVDYRARPLTTAHPLVAAIVRWELNRLKVDPLGRTGEALSPVLSPPATLDDVWNEARDSSPLKEEYVAAQVLIDLIAEKQGPQAIPALLQNLPTASAMDDWLSRSVGLHTADLEAEWELKMRAAVPASGQ